MLAPSNAHNAKMGNGSFVIGASVVPVGVHGSPRHSLLALHGVGMTQTQDAPTCPETIGQRVRRLRTSKGMYQKQLAERAGVCQSVVAKLELDRRGCHFFNMIELARVLGVSLDYIAYGDQK
jgi:DNA-binding XRE family transcriptional regulator